jgi:O-antigen ligase
VRNLLAEGPVTALSGAGGGTHPAARDAVVPLVAALTGVIAFTLGPLYVLPVLALAAWYAVVRIAAVPAAVLPWVAAFALLGDKMVLSTGVGGGSGLLRLGPILTVVLLAAMLVADANTRRAAADVVRWGAPAALVVALGTALPLVGVLIDYPVRTATAIAVPLATGAFLVFGVLVARSGVDPDRVGYLMLVVVTTIAAVTGLLLFLFNRGITLPLAAALDQWGIATSEAYGALWLRGRVSGVYTNPNVLATLGGLALVFAAFARLQPRQRIALIVPSLAILFVTQSRGVLVGVVAAVLVGVVSRERRRETLRWQVIVMWVLIVVLAIAAVVGVAVVFPQYLEALTGRIVSAARILTEGAEADRNFAGRVAFWGSAWDLLQQRALGTFGPPELLLGTAVDNDYLRFALQGGFLYAGAWVLYLGWLMGTGLRRGANRFIGAGAVFLALTALTQTSSTYVMIVGMFSLFVGVHIEQIRAGALDVQARYAQRTTGEG